MIALVLRNRFIPAPISLMKLIDRFHGLPERCRLDELIREYTPEKHEAFLKLPIGQVPLAFAKAFEKRYFPLHVYYHGDTLDLQYIPCEYYGIDTYDDTYRISKGQILAGCLTTAPANHTRSALLDWLREEIGVSLVGRLPERGYTVQQLSKLLKDCPYTGLLTRCKWIHSCTGNIILDTSARLLWTRENVEKIAAAYPDSKLLLEEMKQFDTWVSKDFKDKAKEVIDYLCPERVRIRV